MMHTGTKAFKCNFAECGKTFVTKGNLKTHLSHHTGNKPFQCHFEQCNKRYTNECRLKIHLRTHNGQKPYQCNACEKRFNEKGNLKTHIRIHTGEKPYKCEFPGCGSNFKAYGHLKDHSKIHLNLKPFSCTLCSSKYARGSTLKIHMRIHSENKPYACSYEGCGKKFVEKGNMKTHFQRHYINHKQSEEKVLNFIEENTRSIPSKDETICSKMKSEDKSTYSTKSTSNFILFPLEEYNELVKCSIIRENEFFISNLWELNESPYKSFARDNYYGENNLSSKENLFFL
jgi:uncharacterized Zn-finger protein